MTVYAEDVSRDLVAERLRTALSLANSGILLMRGNLRRRHPHATEAEIEGLLADWLEERPPDAPGRVSEAPRTP